MMHGMLQDTFLEMRDRKTITMFAILTGIALLVFLMGRSMSINIHTEGNADVDLMEGMNSFFLVGISSFVWFTHVIAVFATIGLIPRMLERGRAEFYLAKPISREALFAYKLISIWLVYGASMALSSVIVISAAAAMYGIFKIAVFWAVVFHLLLFAVWLTLTGLFSILTGSQTTTMILAISLWILQLILTQHDKIAMLFSSDILSTAVNTLYYITPKPSLIGDISKALTLDQPVESWEPLWTTVLIAITAYIAAVAFFRKKSY